MDFKLKSFGLFVVVAVIALSGQQACGMGKVMCTVGQTLSKQLPNNASLGLQEQGALNVGHSNLVDKNQGSWLFGFIKRHPGKIFGGLTLCGIGAVVYNLVIGSELAEAERLAITVNKQSKEILSALEAQGAQLETTVKTSEDNLKSSKKNLDTVQDLQGIANQLATQDDIRNQRQALGGLVGAFGQNAQKMVNQGVPLFIPYHCVDQEAITTIEKTKI